MVTFARYQLSHSLFPYLEAGQDTASEEVATSDKKRRRSSKGAAASAAATPQSARRRTTFVMCKDMQALYRLICDIVNLLVALVDRQGLEDTIVLQVGDLDGGGRVSSHSAHFLVSMHPPTSCRPWRCHRFTSRVAISASCSLGASLWLARCVAVVDVARSPSPPNQPVFRPTIRQIFAANPRFREVMLEELLLSMSKVPTSRRNLRNYKFALTQRTSACIILP